jgi:hypothetical protein
MTIFSNTQRFVTKTSKTAPIAVIPSQKSLLQRKCACGGTSGPTGECAECQKKRIALQRKESNSSTPTEMPPIVHEVLRSSGQPLERNTREFMESRFGHDFSGVRVHTDSRAAESARAVNALAYTVGRNVVFDSGRYTPQTQPGQKLMAHELTHVVQQGSQFTGQSLQIESSNTLAEQNADSVAEAVTNHRSIPRILSTHGAIQRRAAPYIKKITVNLTPSQSAALEWEGTPPPTATGSDHFTVSTGKGYSDSEDPAGTCTRNCCSDAETQCAPPWDGPGRTGACCTYIGNNFWTGTPLVEHNGWKWWTPIQPFYSNRGIALHQHWEVTGQPISHGCVRMDEPNAKRIYDFSNRNRTNVTIVGRAAPVACDPDRQCAGSSATGTNEQHPSLEETMSDIISATSELQPAMPGLEGKLS